MSLPVSNVKYIAVNVLVEALGTAKTRYAVAPCDGTIVYIASGLDVTVDGNNILTFGANGTLMTGGTVTHPSSGSAAGEVKACIPTALNTVKRGQTLSAITDGGGSTGQCNVTFLIEQV